MASIKDNLQTLETKINELSEEAGREPGSVKLIGVSKFHPLEAIREARDLGLVDLGENRAQEFSEKYEALKDEEPTIHWHFIGHLQRNKVRDVVGKASLIHSVDSERLLRRINLQAERNDITQKILLQVNITGEEQKYGFTPEDLLAVTPSFAEKYPHVELHGLMCMAELDATEERLKETFDGVRNLLEEIRRVLPADLAEKCTELSMGMSGDYGVAIASGATMIRLGTAIFGEREY